MRRLLFVILLFVLAMPARIYVTSRPRFSPAKGNVHYQWVFRTTQQQFAAGQGAAQGEAQQEKGKAAPGGAQNGATRSLQYAHMGMIERLPNGSIAVAFQGATERYEGSVEQSIYIALSHDSGATWTPPRAVMSGDGVPLWSPVMLVEGGRLWLFFSRSNRKCRYFDRIRAVVRHSPGGDVLFATSDDSSATFSSPQMLYAYGDEGLGIPKVVANKAAVLSDGRWVLPFWREPGKTCPVVRNKLPPNEWVNGSAGVLVSGDQGLTWRVNGHITMHEQGWLIENTVAELPGQQLLQLFRSKQGALYQSWSSDLGKTWSEAQRTSLPNPDSKVHLLRLRMGAASRGTHMVVAYNRSPDTRTPLSLAVSHDPYARQWIEAGSLETAEELEFSYPTMLETRDRLITVYTVMRVEDGRLVSLGIKLAQVSTRLLLR